MENFYLSALIAELQPQLLGRNLSRIAVSADFPSDLLLDFRLRDGRFLKASFEPSAPALYLTSQKREGMNEAHFFSSLMAKYLPGLTLTTILKPPLDRVIQLDFAGFRTSGEKTAMRLFLALTGRTANAYLTDTENQIQAMLKNRSGFRIGDKFSFDNTPFDINSLIQSMSDSPTEEEILSRFFRKTDRSQKGSSTTIFSPLLEKEFIAKCHSLPPKEAFISLLKDLAQNRPQPIIYSSFRLDIPEYPLSPTYPLLCLSHFPLTFPNQSGKNIYIYQYNSLSDASFVFYELKRSLAAQTVEFAAAQRLLNDAIRKLQGHLQLLHRDRDKYENPERFKKYGDLLLASLSTAQIKDSKAIVVDYYSENQSLIEIDIGENKTIQQAAAEYFSLYQKARRALEAIARREAQIAPQIESLRSLAQQFPDVTSIEQVRLIKSQVETILGIKKKADSGQSPKTESQVNRIGRWYRSPAGFDIVVGRNDRENDAITFRLARSLDIWLHAADYPGSHVIIRNPRRDEVPAKVIQEAAELAAFYSQAKNQPKVAVHYTQRKFVTKPPRAKAGLVRLSSFKTILVEPVAQLEKI